MKEKPAIVLFDQDLRLHDNPALVAAAKTSKPLIFLYVHGSGRTLGRGHMWLLSQSLKSLQKKIPLVIRKGNLLMHPEDIKPYKVFTPFWKQCFK